MHVPEVLVMDKQYHSLFYPEVCGKQAAFKINDSVQAINLCCTVSGLQEAEL